MISALIFIFRLLALSQLLLTLSQGLKGPRTPPSPGLMALFALCVMGHLLNEQTYQTETPLGLRLAFITLSAWSPWAFWLWMKSWFGGPFRWRWFYLLPALFLLCWVPAGALPAVAFEPRWVYGINAVATLFMGLALNEIRRDWRADMLEPRRRARLVLMGAVGALAILLIAKTTQDAWLGPNPYFQLAAALAVFGLSLAANLQLLGLNLSLFGAAARAALAPASEHQKAIGQLKALMEEEQIFRTPGLAIGDLAVRMDLPEYKLRRIINQQLGFDNFNTFLNTARIQLACNLLKDSSESVLSIALYVGFNSIAPFNRAFKKAVHCSPSEFRKGGLIES